MWKFKLLNLKVVWMKVYYILIFVIYYFINYIIMYFFLRYIFKFFFEFYKKKINISYKILIINKERYI